MSLQHQQEQLNKSVAQQQIHFAQSPYASPRRLVIEQVEGGFQITQVDSGGFVRQAVAHNGHKLRGLVKKWSTPEPQPQPDAE